MSPFYKGLHHALTSLYGDSFNLSSDNKIFEKVSAAFESVTKWLHRKKNFQPEMLTEKEPQTLIKETFNVLKTPLEDLSIEQDIPEELTRTLSENIFYFSGFKTYHELKEASLLLKDENGGFKSFDRFAQDVKRIDERYNRNYLNAEYDFAVSSSQMAVKWKDYEKDGDRYNLQYRTAADDRVREEHAALHGITLPPSDKFWDKYYPPNGWRCRCTVVQVRKGKYNESNSDDACKAGEKATTHIGKNGSNKSAIFRFNPGKQEKIFPPKHPYYKTSEAVKEVVEKTYIAQRRSEIKKQAALMRTESPVFHSDSNISMIITGKGIDEFLNQPHKHYYEKNELLLDIRSVIEKSEYKGISRFKGRKSHIFETELCGDKTWIIANEVDGRGVALHSISDNEKVLVDIEKPT